MHHGKRAGSKEAVKGSCRKRHASSKSKLKSAAELLVEECGYTMQAVEHAALICGELLYSIIVRSLDYALMSLKGIFS